jgi:hypothetical protein
MNNTSYKLEEQMIYMNQAGRGIGKLEGGIFRKEVSKKKHLMRALYSWGIDKKVLDDLGDDIEIEIFDKDEKKTYVTTASKFREGRTADFGHGEQVFLEVFKFKVTGGK